MIKREWHANTEFYSGVVTRRYSAAHYAVGFNRAIGTVVSTGFKVEQCDRVQLPFIILLKYEWRAVALFIGQHNIADIQAKIVNNDGRVCVAELVAAVT